MPTINRRLEKLEAAAAPVCSHPLHGQPYVVYENDDVLDVPRPDPGPLKCPGCQRPRLRIVVRYVDDWREARPE